jgi:ABC-type transporter Mla subunit MlaD
VPRRRSWPLALAGILATLGIFYAAYAQRVPFVEGYRLEAVVASSNQLKDGAPVRIAGVDVGEVVSSRSGPGRAATIVLELRDAGRPVHADATLRIRPRLFLEGSYFVDLRPGSPSAPELGDGARLALSRTALPVQFSQVLTVLDADVRRGFVGLLDELARGAGGGGAVAAGRAARPAGSVLRDAAVVARAGRGREPRDVTRLVADAGRVAGALASRRGDLQALVRDLRVTTDTLARRDAELAESLREVDATLAAAPAALRAVDGALPPTRRITAALRPSLRALPPVLDDANAGLAQAAGLLGARELPAVVALLDPTVRELGALLPGLRRALALVTPVTDCLRERLVPALRSSVQDGALTTGSRPGRSSCTGCRASRARSRTSTPTGTAAACSASSATRRCRPRRWRASRR